MPRKFAYDYYAVHVPRDAISEEDENHEELFRVAYYIAYERARIWVTPCMWTARIIDDPESADYHVRVCRKRHRTKRSHFHMLVGMPGYLPDTNYTCRTRSEAEWLALCEAKDFRSAWDTENDWSTYIVDGNKHDGYEICVHDVQPMEVYMTIRVTECFEEDCLEEMEE